MNKGYLLLASCITFVFTAEVSAMQQKKTPYWMDLQEEESAIFTAIDNWDMKSLAKLLQDKNPREIAFLLSETRARRYGDNDVRMRSPLMIAVRTGNVGMIKYLLEQGVDPNKTDHNGFTSLLLAMQWLDSKTAERIVNLLIVYGVQVADRDIIYAASHEPALKLILQEAQKTNVKRLSDFETERLSKTFPLIAVLRVLPIPSLVAEAKTKILEPKQPGMESTDIPKGWLGQQDHEQHDLGRPLHKKAPEVVRGFLQKNLYRAWSYSWPYGKILRCAWWAAIAAGVWYQLPSLNEMFMDSAIILLSKKDYASAYEMVQFIAIKELSPERQQKLREALAQIDVTELSTEDAVLLEQIKLAISVS